MRKKNTVIMSVSFLVAVLFIGTAITPVIASLSESISNVERVDAEAETDSATESEEIIDSAEQVESMTETEVAEEGCSLCGDEDQGAAASSTVAAQAEAADIIIGGCENCGEAAVFAIEHMQIDMEGYLEDLLEDGWYFLASADFILEATGSLVYWFAHSGYEIELDVEELTANVQYWVELLVGPQQHLITLFLAALVAVSIGITSYLIILCIGASVPGSAQSAQSTSQETAQSSEVTVATATIPINTIIRSTAYGSMGL